VPTEAFENLARKTVGAALVLCGLTYAALAVAYLGYGVLWGALQPPAEAPTLSAEALAQWVTSGYVLLGAGLAVATAPAMGAGLLVFQGRHPRLGRGLAGGVLALALVGLWATPQWPIFVACAVAALLGSLIASWGEPVVAPESTVASTAVRSSPSRLHALLGALDPLDRLLWGLALLGLLLLASGGLWTWLA
jgi:hypothetical protein